MSRNGSGTFTLPSGSFKPAVSGATPSSSDWNSLTSDLETAMSASIANDGQTTCTASIPFAAGATVKGVTTNSSASAGYIGEQIRSNVPNGSAVSLTDNTEADVTTISLTAGDWDVSAAVWFTGNSSTTATYLNGAISATSATLPAVGDVNQNSQAYSGFALFANVAVSLPMGPFRVSLAGTTTYYLVARAKFAVSTCSAFGTIRARRIR